MDIVANQSSIKRFSTLDYALFAVFLFLSLIIGSAYAFIGGKQKTTQEFLMGDKKMGIFPVGASLIASFVSAISILGTGPEIYLYGTQYWNIVISYGFVILVANYFYLPVFYNLKLTSTYEYLEKRFHRNLRLAGSFTFTIQMVFYLGIVLYAPCLALNQVTGISITASILTAGLVCTFYTSIGGIKAVMWTDAFQIIVMVLGLIIVVIRGVYVVGGVKTIWERSYEGARLQKIDFNFDPFERYTFWTLTIGGFFTWLAIYGVNQAKVQRCLSCPTLRKSQWAMWTNFPCLVIIISLCCYSGLVMYAHFYNCDPILSHQVKSADQMLPLFVLEVINYPGLPGIFISALFCGGMSTMSSGVNALAAVSLEDGIKMFIYPNINETKGAIASKILVAIYGLMVIGVAFISSYLGGVLQTALSIFGMIGGPLLGLFTLGMFFPCANSWGSFLGWIFGMVFSFWIGIGATINKQTFPKLKLRIDGCSNYNRSSFNSFNSTNSFVTSHYNTIFSKPIPKVYQLSYLYFSTLATLSVVIIGLIISLLTRNKNHYVDPILISPPIRILMSWFSKSRTYFLEDAKSQNIVLSL
ncbi:unnamed protein product [Gordionus sp. m RMFG-2023]